MNGMLKKKLDRREKPELIAIIQHMLRQEPDKALLAALERTNKR